MIFVSYRTDDAAPSAHRLSEYLVRRLGSEFVYIDKDRIQRGEELHPSLSAALASCNMLFAVVGQRWAELLKQRASLGTDWVRHEITEALARSVPAMLVRVDNAALPPESDLPEGMRKLLSRRSPVLSLDSWEHDVDALVVETLPLVPELEARVRQAAIANVASGFEMLQRLMREHDDVRVAVVRSVASFRDVHEQIRRLDNLKGIHDAIHDIEQHCLALLQAGGVLGRSTPRFALLRSNFKLAAQAIRGLLREDAVSESLKLTTEETLDAAERAFAASSGCNRSSLDAVETVTESLRELVSRVPARLDSEMTIAATRLPVGDLIQVVQGIAECLSATGLAPMKAAQVTEGITALSALHKQLEARLQEHNRVQEVDMQLRVLPTSSVRGQPLTREQWERVKRRRDRWGDPVSQTLANALTEIDAMALQLEAALATDSKQCEEAPEEILAVYAGMVASAFNGIDKELRRLCADFVNVGTPIKVILDLSAQRRAL